MTNIKLSKRLSLIAQMVDKDAVLADIGCDHALLDIYLVQNKIIKKSIACDITSGALNQANKNIYINNIKNIETRLGDGLKPINDSDKVNLIVISGLGNQKILEILSSDLKKLNSINTIIIQSNTNVSKLRKDMVNLGYYVKEEGLVKENKIIYVVIKFCKGIKKYSKKELFFGPVLLTQKNDLFNELLTENINKNKQIIKKLPINKIGKKIKFLCLNKMLYNQIKRNQV